MRLPRELRKASNYIPLLMLTARGSPEDVLKGFESGADDYLPKPFDLAILLARIRGLLRRRDWGRTLLTDPPADVRVAEPSKAGVAARVRCVRLRRQAG